MTQSTEPCDIPLHRINFDHGEFAKCSHRDKVAVLYFMKRGELYGYLARSGAPPEEVAYLDLNEYASYNDYVAQCRRVLKGNAVRDALKAERKGYFTKFFNKTTFLPDIVAVDTSAPERQGLPLPAYRLKTVEERGGYPQSFEPEVPPTQSFTWIRYFGIFRGQPGHRQGQVVVDEQLAGYLILRRCADFATYTTLFGHARYLSDGIVYKMHLDLVRLLLDQRQAGENTDQSGVGRGHYGIYFMQGIIRQARGLSSGRGRCFSNPGSSNVIIWRAPILNFRSPPCRTDA